MVKKRPLSDGESLEKGIVALCGERGCCPLVNFMNPNKVVLTDDLGGRVQLTRAQWEDLKARFATASRPTRRT